MRPDATDLIRWADRLDCRARLPELIRRLVHSTTEGLVEVDFAAGEGVQRPGIDGRVRAVTGNAFVPRGLSIWEIGASQGVTTKAAKDLAKRTRTPPAGINPADTTFVFVTPRRWTSRDDWIAARRAEKIWGDVRVYDADSLEQWLELSPAASAWLAPIVGRPSDVQSIEDHFEEWSLGTEPPTPARILLQGRDDAQATLLSWLGGSPSALPVPLADVGEAAAFLYAVLQQRPGREGRRLMDRCVVLQSDRVLREVGSTGQPQIIVALDCGLDVARKVAKEGHHVLVAMPQLAGDTDRLKLGALHRPGIAAILEEIGYTEEEAKRLSRESHGDLVTLRGLLQEPTSRFADELAPLVLVGAWDEANNADLSVVREISGLTDGELRALLRRHSVGPGSPLQRAGTSWGWRSRLDAWRGLAAHVQHADLERFRDVTLGVLGVNDPALELPVEERWMAPVRGKIPAHSSGLRHSLAETAAILGAVRAPAGSNDTEAVAAQLVFEVLRGATTWERWATLGDYLPLLAEASPGAFLRGVRELLQRRPAVVTSLCDASRHSGLHTADYLNGLLWAMETLAWSPEHLLQTGELLAVIAELEAATGEERGRALRSLREIFLPWLPHTTAPLATRIAAMQSIVRRDSPERFRFLLSLLPRRGGDSSTPTHKPAWRQWLDGWTEGVTLKDVHEMHVAVWDEVARAVESNPERWAAVITQLDALSTDVHRPRVLMALRAFDFDTVSADLREEVWSTLRHVLHSHRSVPGAEWALPDAELRLLEQVYERIAPENLRVRHGWLFTRNPELPGVVGHDWHAEQAAIAAARAEACHEIYAREGAAGLLALASAAEVPVMVGRALRKADGVAMCREVFHACASDASDWAWRLRVGIATGFVDVAEDPLKHLEVEALPSSAKADVALGMAFCAATWAIVDEWGEEARRSYWQRVQPGPWDHQPAEVSRVVRALLGVGRPLDAIDFMGMYLHVAKDAARLDPRDVVDVLKGALSADAARRISTMDVHHAAKLFDVLQAAGPEWERDLASLEWAWFDAMDHVRDSHLLFRTLAESPSFFVELLSLVFRAEEEEPREVTEEESARARNAYRVLERWNRMPGVNDEGGVDNESLRQWVAEVRRLAREAKRAEIADERVGQVLARSPNGDDGIWPHEAVRRVLEELGGGGNVEQGFCIGRRNQRGTFGKAIGEGGAQERAIAARYWEAADALSGTSPVTAGLLRNIAEGYEHDARREDHRGDRDADAFIWAADDESRLAAWVDGLQASGRYHFTQREAADLRGLTNVEVKRGADALIARGRLLSPTEGFYVIVPLEYKASGGPPPSWFIDGWMSFLGRRYHVGLLTAAALYGASHQQAQEFQVLVDGHVEPVALGRARVVFVADADAGTHASAIKAEAASMLVSDREQTALDLIRHATAAGGIDAVATVLSELMASIDTAKLEVAARRYPVGTVQRLGSILVRLGRDDLARRLRGLVPRVPDPVCLRSDDPAPVGAEYDAWGVHYERELEVDQ